MALQSSDAEYPNRSNRDRETAVENVSQIFHSLSLLQAFKQKIQNPVNGHVELIDLARLVPILEVMLRCICANHEKIKVWQDALAALTSTIENTNDRNENTKQEQLEITRMLKDKDKRILHLEQKLAMQEAQICQLLMTSLQVSEEPDPTNGILMWCIENYRQRKQEAKSSGPSSFYSNDFYSDPHGYRMCARVYLNGDGVGKNSHLSIFFAIKKGKYDDILKWPFGQRVQFSLLNQNGGEHLSDAFKPDPTSSSFKKPTSDLNIASGCPMFATQQVVETRGYLKNNKIWIKVTVGQ